jgi:23S rRNA (cytosine1962-C5)-methyltransferase
MARQAYRGDLHPHSIKYMNMGHPWIIKDQFTDKFPPQERFIIATNKGRPMALCLHDYKHRKIKARLWSREGNFEKQIESFSRDMIFRLSRAIQKRKTLNLKNQRDNFYLIFGEGDSLPGLFVLYLGGEILIQYYSFFWEKYQRLIIDTITSELSNVFQIEIESDKIWIQTRSDGSFPQEGAKCIDINLQKKKFEIQEFGINYKVKLGSRYDIGIYTDMSSIREKIKKYFNQNNKVANLFCYTGAFSLLALKLGASKVHSVDISEKYLSWLNENIAINPDLKSEHHTSFEMPSQDYINKELNSGTKDFDIIISDPPSFSSDGNRQNNSLDFYEKNLENLLSLLKTGGKCIAFINTHSITRGKFKQILGQIIQNKAKIIEELSLAEDCPKISGFPEGDYLKGLVIEKL